MIDQIFEKRPKRHIRDLNIVPILDMLTTVIFFLLMSTSFMEYTKLTVPPASTSVLTSAGSAPPLSPKLFLVRSGEELTLSLRWSGSEPGEAAIKVNETEPDETRGELYRSSKKLIEDFASTRPGERTLQMGLGPLVPYQYLISVMDGVRGKMPDVVLVSYREAEARVGREELPDVP